MIKVSPLMYRLNIYQNTDSCCHGIKEKDVRIEIPVGNVMVDDEKSYQGMLDIH